MDRSSSTSGLPATLVIHASELAACIGKNRFKTPPEMVAQFLARLGLYGAQRRFQEGARVRDRAAEAAQLAAELRAHPMVRETDLDSLISVIEGPGEQRAHRLVASARESVEGFDAPAFIEGEGRKAQAALAALVDRGTVSAQQAHVMQSEYVSRMSRSCGTLCEEDVVDKLCRERGWRIDRSAHECYRKRLVGRSRCGTDVYIGGKIDGYLCDPAGGGRKAVLEIKNRVSRLFKRVYDYERIQVLAYMFINDMTESPGVLVERHGRADILAHAITFDAHYWQGTVVAGLLDFVGQLHAAAAAGDPGPGPGPGPEA